MKARPLPFAAALLALWFVLSPDPAAAAGAAGLDAGCYACEMCHPEMSCLSCGVMALNSISGCCGLGNGQTYCVPDYGGFAVNCDNGSACQCNMNGDNCDALGMAGG